VAAARLGSDVIPAVVPDVGAQRQDRPAGRAGRVLRLVQDGWLTSPALPAALFIATTTCRSRVRIEH
jgi:hypothetical protein